MLKSFVYLLVSRVIRLLRFVTFTKKALELLLLQITEVFWELKVRWRVHVASAEATKHGKEINLAYVSQGKKDIECIVAAAKTH